MARPRGRPRYEHGRDKWQFAALEAFEHLARGRRAQAVAMLALTHASDRNVVSAILDAADVLEHAQVSYELDTHVASARRRLLRLAARRSELLAAAHVDAQWRELADRSLAVAMTRRLEVLERAVGHAIPRAQRQRFAITVRPGGLVVVEYDRDPHEPGARRRGLHRPH